MVRMLTHDQEKLQMMREGTLDGSSPLDPQPQRLSLPLKPHQRAALHAMRQLEEGPCMHHGMKVRSTVGLLCDRVGSGKSFEILARICQQPSLLAQEQMQGGICIETVQVQVQVKSAYTMCGSNLVVVPHGIVSQWRSYVENHTDLTIAVVQRRSHIAHVVRSPPVEVVICSATMCRDLIDKTQDIQWSRIVVDECTSIQLPRCPTLRGCFHWLISSSVHTILFPSGSYCVAEEGGDVRWRRCESMQRTGFLRQVLQHLEMFPTVAPLFLKCNDTFVEDSFQLPPLDEITLRCQAPAYLSIVHGVASPEITRILHAGDMDGALQLLPCPRGTADNLFSRLTTDLHDKIVRKEAKVSYYQQLLLSERDPLTRQVLEQRLREATEVLEQLQTQRQTVQQRLQNHDGEMCPVCLDKPEHACITGCCKHIFCVRCLQQALALTPQCPYCRRPAGEDTMMLITAEHDAKPPERPPSKVDQLLRCLQRAEAEAPGRWRMLVFSNYESFDKITIRLHGTPFPYSKLCGTGATIQRQVQKFESGATPVLLLNSTHYGAGLNLQAATHVVTMHRMEPDMEAQVIGRAQRPGRTSTLQLIRLLHDDE